MADLGGHSQVSAQDVAIDDDAAADARSERQQDQIVHVPAGANPFFSKRRSIGVVFKNHFGAEALFDFIPHRVVVEGGQVGSPDYDSFVHQDKSRYAYA